MKSKIRPLMMAGLLAAVVPSMADAAYLEVTFSGTIPGGGPEDPCCNSYDQTNVFGFGAGSLDGRTVTGMLRFDLSRAPSGVYGAPPTTPYSGMNYWNPDASNTTNGFGTSAAAPGGSWVESWFRVDGVLAPDWVSGSGNNVNRDIAVLYDNGADSWYGVDLAGQVDEPTPGQAISRSDMLWISIFNAPGLLNSLELDQEFTLDASSEFNGVGRFEYFYADNFAPASDSGAFGDFNLDSVRARVVDSPVNPVPLPAAAWLLLSGLGGLGLLGRRRKAA